MSEEQATFRHYGVSPWEIEVIFDTLRRSFAVIDQEQDSDDVKFVSMIELCIPMTYSEDFFQFFTWESWFKIKGVLKDIKRRRGRKGLKCIFRFDGFTGRDMFLYFLLTAKNDRHFEMALEKLEYLIDIVPAQTKGLPEGTGEVWFSYEESTLKWHPANAKISESNYIFKNQVWISN